MSSDWAYTKLILTENFQKQLIWGKISFLKLSTLNNSYQV